MAATLGEAFGGLSPRWSFHPLNDAGLEYKQLKAICWLFLTRFLFR
jgi:hypothetical protein